MLYNSLIEVKHMPIKYYKLLDLLNRRNISKTKFRLDIGIGTSTLAKISNHENIAMDIIEKSCSYLQVQPGDLMEYVDDDKFESKVK